MTDSNQLSDPVETIPIPKKKARSRISVTLK